MTAQTVDLDGPILLGRFLPGSPEWHAARANGIGGSEIAAVLGLSPYESRFSLWHRKKELLSAVVQNDVMDAGTRLEPVIIQKFADKHPEYQVRTSGTYCHSARPWQIANPDGLLATGHGDGLAPVALVEAKFALYPDGWGYEGTDEVPVHYRCQTLWYLDVLGLDRAYVEVFIGSCAEWRTYVIEAAPDEQAFLRDAGAEFMRTLQADERPDIDAHDATYSALREQHPDIDDVDVQIDPDLADRYRAAIAGCDQADEEKQLVSSLVLDAIGRGRRAVCGAERIAMRVPGRGTNPPYLKCTPPPKTPVLTVKGQS